jgi:hypothetical protein
MRVEELEPSTAGRLFDVPAHLYRQALVDLIEWGRYSSGGTPPGPSAARFAFASSPVSFASAGGVSRQ